MLWIKRNILLVIGLTVSLALLGGAGYYLYHSFYDNDDQDVLLAQLRAELEGFKSGIYPSPENISMVKSNTALAERFMAATERMLAVEAYKPLAAATLHNELPRILDRLRREATNASVELPPRYEFTFGEIKAQPRIVQYAVEPLVSQLAEVGTLCGVLFKAKVRALESLQRVPVAGADQGGVDLLMDLAQRTNVISSNASVIITPYRVTFRGFSSELTAVLNGFARTKEFMALRQIDVEAGASARDQLPGGMLDPNTMMMTSGAMTPGLPGMGLPGAPGVPFGGGAPNLAAPPGSVPPPPRPPAPVRPGGAVPPPPPKSGLTPILDEKILRVTLVVDVVKVARRPGPAAPQGR